MAILVSDGAANIDVERTLPNAIEARNDGVLMIAVSVGLDANLALLGGIVTRPPESHLFYRTTSRTLPEIVGSVIEATCNNVDECASRPCLAGGRCLDRVSYTYLPLRLFVCLSLCLY